MRIGELARETGCQVETIRYYKRAGVRLEALFQKDEAIHGRP